MKDCQDFSKNRPPKHIKNELQFTIIVYNRIKLNFFMILDIHLYNINVYPQKIVDILL